MWVIICTLELILSILNQGFLEEGLEELKGIEKALRIMWFACTGFVIVWAIIGFVWMSGYQECRDRKFYLGYNDFWANSVLLLMC